MIFESEFFSTFQVCFAWSLKVSSLAAHGVSFPCRLGVSPFCHKTRGTWRCWASCLRRIPAPTPWSCPITTSPCRTFRVMKWCERWWVLYVSKRVFMWKCSKNEGFAAFGLGLEWIRCVGPVVWCFCLECRRSVGVTSHRRLLLYKQGWSKKCIVSQCVMLTCWGNPKDSQIKFSPC